MRLPVFFSAPSSRRDLLPLLRQSPSLLPRTRPTVSAPCLQLPLSASCHSLHRGGFGRTLASVSPTSPSRKHTASRKVCLLREQSYKPRQRIIIYRAFETSPQSSSCGLPFLRATVSITSAPNPVLLQCPFSSFFFSFSSFCSPSFGAQSGSRDFLPRFQAGSVFLPKTLHFSSALPTSLLLQ